MSTTRSQVTFQNLNGGTLPQVQFSVGWLADDTYETFNKLWGNGERVNDAAAWGGTAFRLYPGNGESSAWVWDTTFVKDVPLVAYFRLKVNNNTSSSEVVRVMIEGGSINYGPLILRGTDFTASNQYQEFALNFTFNYTADHPFLTFHFSRNGSADVYIDAVSIFTAPQVITSPLTWSVPGGNYRGQGVWVRYTNGSQFSALSEAATTREAFCGVNVSGNTGVSGAIMSYMDGTAKTGTSYGTGNYSITVSKGWSGTVTPSHACFTFSPTSRTYSNLSTNQTSQNYTSTLKPGSGCASINVLIAGSNTGKYGVAPGKSVREGYPGVDNGPARIGSTNNVNTLAALRVIWKEPGPRYSYSEMMGLPKEQLSNEYWFPWYNNAAINSMDQGFRIANVDIASGNTVEVWVGNTRLDTMSLAAGASVRVGYNVDNGPIRIVCITCTNTGNDKIIAALRVIWKEPGFRASYSEMMGLPKEQLSNEYWFPWYNNAATNSMDQGFRIANVDSSPNTVEVWVGNTKLDAIMLGSGASTRVGYSVDNGPIHIICTTCTNTGNDKIIAALRVIWKEPGFRASYSEMMGLPKEQLSNEYWFPWYNNAATNSMDQGFRIANVDLSSGNTVEVWVGNTKLDTISLLAGASIRVGYNVDNGPIKILCTTCANTGNDTIIAALRVIWKEPGFRSSYSEMMGLPVQALSTEYWFPWYNNAAINSMDQGLRIAVP